MVLLNTLIFIGVNIFLFKRGGLGAVGVFLFGMIALSVASAHGVPSWAIFIMSLWLGFIIPRRPSDNPEPKI